MRDALIAVDWGTTSARAYRVDRDGVIVDERHAQLGIASVRDGAFDRALATLLGEWASDPLPRLACGMIGSRQGWIEAPYLACPADLAGLARALARTPGGELAIVPGVSCRDDAGIPDVMRGEETQLVGALGEQGEPTLAVLPGTHSKWARVAHGRIETFATFMTGEVYAVLLAHSILGRMAERAPATPGAAFARGVACGLGSGGLLHRLFGARTLALGGELAASEVADWLSGLLIGREIHNAGSWARCGGDDGSRVRVIGDDALAARYVAALAHAGIDAQRAPPGAAARGLFHIARRAHLID
jgi:2-dehydro-3-deoxygalactonokinase